jgi:uncharacterized protein YcgL (UPF0745 family)
VRVAHSPHVRRSSPTLGHTTPTTMLCDIYRPKARSDLYLFVRSGTSPHMFLADMLSQLGELELLKTREVVEGQSLIGASADEIIKNITQTGFHIQGVKVTTQVSDGGAAIGGGLLGASVGGPAGAIIGAIIGLVLAEHAKKVPNDL